MSGHAVILPGIKRHYDLSGCSSAGRQIRAPVRIRHFIAGRSIHKPAPENILLLRKKIFIINNVFYFPVAFAKRSCGPYSRDIQSLRGITFVLVLHQSDVTRPERLKYNQCMTGQVSGIKAELHLSGTACGLCGKILRAFYACKTLRRTVIDLAFQYISFTRNKTGIPYLVGYDRIRPRKDILCA